jgi:dGTPase
VHEAVRRLIDLMVNDLLDETRRRLGESMPESADDVRRLGRPVVSFSTAMRAHDRALREFLFERMYRHERVNRMTETARNTVRDLFGHYMGTADALPPDWRRLCPGGDSHGKARVVADYIAGMTDRFALDEHARLFGSPAPH